MSPPPSPNSLFLSHTLFKISDYFEKGFQMKNWKRLQKGISFLPNSTQCKKLLLFALWKIGFLIPHSIFISEIHLSKKILFKLLFCFLYWVHCFSHRTTLWDFLETESMMVLHWRKLMLEYQSILRLMSLGSIFYFSTCVTVFVILWGSFLPTLYSPENRLISFY